MINRLTLNSLYLSSKQTSFLFTMALLLSFFLGYNATARTGGDAVYREGAWPNVLDHGGVYDISGNVYEIKGPFHEVELSTWASFLGGQYDYGAFCNYEMMSLDRENILDTCDELDNDPDITYTASAALYHEDTGGRIDVYEITDIRCDGVVEYAYERNGIWVWGRASPANSGGTPTHFDISVSAYCIEHENLGGDEPWIELSPKVQRGGSGTLWTKLRLSPDTPGSPGGVSASDGTYTDKVRVSWDSYEIPDSSYRVYRSTSSTGTKTALGSWQTSTIYDDSSAIAGTTYYYWVRGALSGVESDYSSYDTGWRAIIDIAPPTLSSPSNASTVNGTTIAFRWNSSVGANNYYLQVATDSSFNNTVFDDEIGNYVGADMSGFSNDGTRFYWHVKAGNSAGWSGYSSTWNFNNGTVSIPLPPTLSSPSNASTVNGTTIAFRWNSSVGANNYYLQVATDSSFNNTVFDDEIGNYVGTDISGFSNDGTRFYWHVKAGNSAGWSGYSSTRYFDNGTASLPPPPIPASISYPISSSSPQYTVSWSSSSGATSYQLERSDNGGGSWSQVYSGSESTYQEYICNGSYRYRVKATNSYGSSGWQTGTWDCVVNIPDPDLNADGNVNFADYAILAANWLQLDCGISNDWCNQADIDHSTYVSFEDVLLLAENWLVSTTPECGDGICELGEEGTGCIDCGHVITIATFADPSWDSNNPLFTVAFIHNSLTGGWSDDKVGLTLQIPYNGNTFSDAWFDMTPVSIDSLGNTGSGTIRFFEDGALPTSTPLVQIDFPSGFVSRFGFGADELFVASSVTITGSQITDMLSEEQYAFSFQNKKILPGSTNLNDGFTATAAFTSSAMVSYTIGPNQLVWVSINDPGVDDTGDGIPDHEGFNGQMSKYETTNAQYCQYLNAVKAANQITVYNNVVYAISDTTYSQPYYNIVGAGYTIGGATNGGAARINWTGSSFTVDSGFENHPVTYVSWYGSTAFASYYGWRLPTEWEWQAVADHTVADPYAYGCGATINNSKANYYGSTHPYGTTAVGAFG
ncbi:MAG: SUMF1/EgtB/PvdO family nonheme iron enzyme, partial [Sedimentisphaerales bacterium]